MVRLLTQHGQSMDWNDVKPHPLPDNLVFLDLLNPTREEELEAEKWLEHLLPTREEMQEIEESSRLYVENEVLYMTAWVPVGLDTQDPDNTSISFVLSRDTLTAVRYADPLPFRTLFEQAKRKVAAPISSEAMFLLLLEVIVARIADALQNVETDLKRVCRDVFAVQANKATAGSEQVLADVVKLLGRRNAMVAHVRESLLSINRMVQFFLNNAATWMRPQLAASFRTVVRDIRSLDDYTTQQGQEMNFLLDSTLGLINIQQNQIIKIFTVASVLFMPPTLIASIYGMNTHLPVADHDWAFPLIMLIIVASAIGPIWFFKRKGLL